MNLKQNIKDYAVAIAVGVSLIAMTATAASTISWILATNGAGQSVATLNTNVPIAIPMGQDYMTSLVATTTAGSLATSTIAIHQGFNGTGTLTKPLTYYAEVAAVDVSGGISLPSINELSSNVSSSAANNEIVSTWGTLPGAAYYNLYLGTSSGGEQFLASTTATTYTITTSTVSSVIPQTVNAAYVDTINPNGKSYLGGDLQVYHLNGSNVATVATGTAAGTGATDTLAYATDLSGVISLHTGTTAMGTSSALFTVTYGEAYAKAPACSLFPENAASAAITTTSTPYMIPGTTSSVAEANVTGLSTGTLYTWGWICSN